MKKKISKVKTTKFYKKLVIIFLILALLTLGFIIYFSLSKTSIYISLKPIDTSTSFTIDVKKELSDEEKVSNYKISGKLVSVVVSDSLNVVNTNQGEQTEAQATGTVTIYNNWSDEQPLAATTRLLTPDGILFRIKDRVDVPAGGQLDNVEVYADQPGAAGNIEPTTFTIPGLWPGLQDKIYAESSAPMTGGLREVKIVTQEIINEAQSSLKQDLIKQASQEIDNSEELKDMQDKKIGKALATITLEKDSTASIGDEVDSFKVSMKLKVIAVVFDENQLLNIALNRLKEEIASDMRIYEEGDKNLTYSPQEHNLEDETASINVELSAKIVPQQTSPIFNKDNLTNKNSQEINEYFSNFNGILSVEINYSPFWVTKTPALKDHIELRIK